MAGIDRIDIGALFDGPWHHRDAVDARIARAMRTQRSFSVHNFPWAKRLGAWAGTMLRFFELTDQEKYEIAVKTVNPDGARIYRGYECREPSREDLAPALFAEEDPDLRLSFGRHVDSSGISLLWQIQPGLQAQGNDGTWRDILPSEEAVSVHIGTVVSLLSGGCIPATPHRVVDMGGARRSIGFFLEPALDAVMQPVNHVPSVADGSHPASNTYGWHLQRTFYQRTRYQDLVPIPCPS